MSATDGKPCNVCGHTVGHNSDCDAVSVTNLSAHLRAANESITRLLAENERLAKLLEGERAINAASANVCDRLKAQVEALGESFAAECETTHQLRAQVEALTRERDGLRWTCKEALTSLRTYTGDPDRGHYAIEDAIDTLADIGEGE